MIRENDPAWDCPGCGSRFGDSERRYKKQADRSAEEWVELIKTMLPAPVRTNEVGELLGGDPMAVIVRVDANRIRIMEASIEWDGASHASVERAAICQGADAHCHSSRCRADRARVGEADLALPLVSAVPAACRA